LRPVFRELKIATLEVEYFSTGSHLRFYAAIKTMKQQNPIFSELTSGIKKKPVAPTQEYVLGDAENELRRLVSQSQLIGDITEQVVQRAGIKPGMNVLDCGCGAGDVSFLIARLVGSGGRVLGIDRSIAGISRARERAAKAGLPNVSFEVVDDLAEFKPPVPVDGMVGRLILMYLREPAAILRHLARQVRPGGVIVFQELVLSMCRSEPSCPLAEKCSGWINDTFARAGADVDMGWKLFATFQRAGLPNPELFLGSPIGAGPDSPMYRHIAETVRSLLPMMEHFGVASAKEVMVDDLADRLRTEMSAAGTVCATPCLIGAWTRKIESF
jgi:SAM-dependent methyltransferase